MTAPTPLNLDPGKTMTLNNEHSETLAVAVKTSDGCRVEFNVLPGQAARIIAGSGSIEIDIDKYDSSLVGIRQP